MSLDAVSKPHLTDWCLVPWPVHRLFCGLPILQALTASDIGPTLLRLLCRAPDRADADVEVAEAPPQHLSLRLSDLVPEAPEAAQRILKGNCHPWQVRAAVRTSKSMYVDCQKLSSGAEEAVVTGLSLCGHPSGVLLSCWWIHCPD